MQTSDDGWFTAELDTDDFVFYECGAHAGLQSTFPPTPERSWNPSMRSNSRREFPPGAERVLVINPFTRRAAQLSEAEWKTAPQALLQGAWVTEVQATGAGLLRVPGDPDGKGESEAGSSTPTRARSKAPACRREALTALRTPIAAASSRCLPAKRAAP